MGGAAIADPVLIRQSLLGSLSLLELDATGKQVEQLLGFLALLERWNRTYNLTSIRDVGAMLSHHLVDCLAVVGPLRRERSSGIGRLLDVGSGAGLPGVVIAVMEPLASVVCVDAVGKKSAFVQQVAASLGLANLRSAHARVETLQADPFDVVTSRAFASLVDFVALTRRLLDREGIWLAMKGRQPDTEIAQLPVTVDVFHVEQLALDESVGERCVVWMRPQCSQVSASFAGGKEPR